MRAAALSFACALAACSEPPAFLSSAGLPGLVLVQSLNGEVTAVAYDVSGNTKLELPFPHIGSLFALGYRETLAELELAPGPIAIATKGDPFPAATEIHRLGASDWIKLDAVADAVPDEIAGLHLPAPDPCADFEVTIAPFTLGRATFAVTVDGERALIGTQEGHVGTLGEAGIVELPAGTPSLAGFAHGADLWLAGPTEAVVHGSPDRGFVPGPPLPFVPEDKLWIDGSRGDAPFELFAVDGAFRVAHFDGTAWQQIRGPRSPGIGGRLRPRIAWIDSGLAVVVGAGTSTIVEISSTGAERVIALDLGPRVGSDSPWTVAYVAGVGMVVGTRYSLMYVRGSAGWEQLPLALITPRADVFYDLGDGAFMAGGQDGQFAQWGPGSLLCMVPPNFGSSAAHALAPIGDGFVLIGGTDDGGPFTSYRAKRRR